MSKAIYSKFVVNTCSIYEGKCEKYSLIWCWGDSDIFYLVCPSIKFVINK